MEALRDLGVQMDMQDRAVSRPEITAPLRPRVFGMAVTARDNRDRGRPSAWSAALDSLAATRSGEVRGTAWTEIDRDQGVWTIPAPRTKANREHRVPLCRRALEILDEVLAHTVRNQIEAAYRRSDLFERRRRLMDDWASYLAGESRQPEDEPIR